MAKFIQNFNDIKLDDLIKEAQGKKDDAWRFVQILALKSEKGTDLIYSFMKDGILENLKIKDIQNEDIVPSITEFFIEAFVFENEIHDLFNVTIKDIAIDFKGKFYNVAIDAPMSVVSPEAIARKEKQAKIDAALKAKAAKAKAKAPKVENEKKQEVKKSVTKETDKPVNASTKKTKTTKNKKELAKTANKKDTTKETAASKTTKKSSTNKSQSKANKEGKGE